MIICVCNGVTSKAIEDCVGKNEVKTISDLQKEMKICNQCKTCTNMIKDIIVENTIKIKM